MTVADGVLALVKAALPNIAVYDGKVDTDAQGTPLADRYVVFYPDSGRRYSEDAANTIDLAQFRFQLTFVGRNEQADRWAVQWMVDRCLIALVGARPSAAGWQTGPIVHEGGTPIRRDDDEPGALVLFATESFSLLASRT